MKKRNISGEFLHSEQEINEAVHMEAERANVKHGDSPIFADRHSFLSILTEEVGEIAKDINKRQNSGLICKEIIQVMAVCSMYLQGVLHDSPK